ncbi:MAG: hypothetical protein HC831_08025 [Chloroflexia bacterium]|nr:hypothetical protein [Chloroflexia bacterium]
MKWRTRHIEWSNKNEVHAEQALISEAARNGIKLTDIDVYISLQPCVHCAKLLAALGPNNIFYVKEYDRGSKDSISLINQAGIIIQKI